MRLMPGAETRKLDKAQSDFTKHQDIYFVGHYIENGVLTCVAEDGCSRRFTNYNTQCPYCHQLLKNWGTHED